MNDDLPPYLRDERSDDPRQQLPLEPPDAFEPPPPPPASEEQPKYQEPFVSEG